MWAPGGWERGGQMRIGAITMPREKAELERAIIYGRGFGG
jgi:hypothetical protein